MSAFIARTRCIPYKIKKDGEGDTVDCESRLELLMVSSPGREDLVFPKLCTCLFSLCYLHFGGWEDDETIGEAACHEALEEARVKGILDGSPLGMWEFISKIRKNSCSTEVSCRGYMFALEVTEELDTWPEEDKHGRRCGLSSVSLQMSVGFSEIFPVGIHYSDMGKHSDKIILKILYLTFFSFLTTSLASQSFVAGSSSSWSHLRDENWAPSCVSKLQLFATF
ncbi:hypothetical protein MKW92_029806 [Papaver armeniacum]|nr:hypothetical protein MKW92_029806 [Papaver armeniacum]